MAELRRLFPDSGMASVAAVAAGLDFSALAPSERPYVVANMVCSVDGRTTLAGRSGGLGSAADRELFHGLRTRVDAVLVGTGTLAVERYGGLARRPEVRNARVDAGLPATPVAVLISRSGALPLSIPLFDDPEARVLVFCPLVGPLPARPARVELTTIPLERLTPAEVLRRLRQEHGIHSVLCEGGPTLLGSLVAEDLLDELFLTVSPLLAGESGPAVLARATPPAPLALELGTVHLEEGTLFLRYLRRSGGSARG